MTTIILTKTTVKSLQNKYQKHTDTHFCVVHALANGLLSWQFLRKNG